MRVAIQGERGSNSHMAALRVDAGLEVVPCTRSAEVFAALESGRADRAVLPIENSLHGSVAEHYDLMLEHGAGTPTGVRITGETLLRIRHNVIAIPGVRMEDVTRILSHPVALNQCRRWLRQHPRVEAVQFYDTAGAVKHILENGLRDTAGIAASLAAEEYGGQILEGDIEDHQENFTRFYTLVTGDAEAGRTDDANKISVAFSVEHRPGTLIAALEVIRAAGLDLTKIESRPVPGRPWEYLFFVDARYEAATQADAAVAGLRAHCSMVRVLGRYRAAENEQQIS